MVWSTSDQGRFDILTMMLDPSYQRHITFACTGCYQAAIKKSDGTLCINDQEKADIRNDYFGSV